MLLWAHLCLNTYVHCHFHFLQILSFVLAGADCWPTYCQLGHLIISKEAMIQLLVFKMTNIISPRSCFISGSWQTLVSGSDQDQDQKWYRLTMPGPDFPKPNKSRTGCPQTKYLFKNTKLHEFTQFISGLTCLVDAGDCLVIFVVSKIWGSDTPKAR